MRRFVCNEDDVSTAVSSHIENIIQKISDEFGAKAELFTPAVVRMDGKRGNAFEKTKSPGVYVFLNDAGDCLKVGKSHSNASKRALEHCRDNTRSEDDAVQMANLHSSNQTFLLVFALPGRDHQHWVLALEHFLERSLGPIIQSQRNG